MALRDIVKDGDALLRKTSREVTAFDAKLAQILDDMLETMIGADGVGLAAPQIGILRRFAICQMSSGEIVELINPVILQAQGQQTDKEGCLSCPQRYAAVTRPKEAVKCRTPRTICWWEKSTSSVREVSVRPRH